MEVVNMATPNSEKEIHKAVQHIRALFAEEVRKLRAAQNGAADITEERRVSELGTKANNYAVALLILNDLLHEAARTCTPLQEAAQ
jgi:hypothetical protein